MIYVLLCWRRTSAPSLELLCYLLQGDQNAAMHHAVVKRMLGVIKYNPSKDPEKKADADAALAMYNSLADHVEDRKRFVQEFEACGGGKGKDGLKFALNFVKSVKNSESTSIATTEFYYTRIAPSCV